MGPKEDDHWPDIDGREMQASAIANIGDVIVYDRSLFHRAGANLGNRTRGVFYMTFIGPGGIMLDQKPAILNELLQPPRGPVSIHDLGRENVSLIGTFPPPSDN